MGVRRGRPEGSGRWGSKTRVARVPVWLSDEELEASLELVSLVRELATDSTPLYRGTVRGSVHSRLKRDLREMFLSLGLPLRARMGESVGLTPHTPEENPYVSRQV